jgi:hypothetical protein
MVADAMAMLDRSQERRYRADEQPHVFVWDIDKTYLETRFSSWRGLLAIPFELAVDKVAARGAVELLRALREGPNPHQPRLAPLYFISGSPKQLRRVIEQKMMLDGIQADGMTFKDQWGLLRRGRPQAILEQVGYKTLALLSLRLELPAVASFTCFGDDVESDAEAFLLVGQILAGLRGSALRHALRDRHVGWPETEAVLRLSDRLTSTTDELHQVFIRRVRNRSQATDERVMVIDHYGQAASRLHHQGHISDRGLAAVLAAVQVTG